MKQTEGQAAPIGLDIGTSRIVVARHVEKEFHFASQLNAFVRIPFSKITEDVLQKEQIPYTADGSVLFVHGDASQRFADLLKSEINRPMDRGFLNPSEPDGLRLIREIVNSMTGKSDKHRKLCFTVPAAPAGTEENFTYHEAALRQELESLGFEARSLNEGLAVVYSELEASNFTGIGISCGGGLCNVCLSYLSVPITSFSLPKAGDFIDTSAASVTGELANRIRILKEESLSLNNGHMKDKVQRVLSVYYDDMIRSLAFALKETFANVRGLPEFGKPIPLVLAGGTAMPVGFRDRFEAALRETGFPIPLSEIRLATDPLGATAKGALVAALSEM